MPSGEPSTAGHFEHLPRGSFGRILSVLNAAADHHPRELLVVGIATFDQKRPAVGVDEHDPGGAATPAVVINYESRSSAGGTIGHSTTSQVACCLYQQPKRPALRPQGGSDDRSDNLDRTSPKPPRTPLGPRMIPRRYPTGWIGDGSAMRLSIVTTMYMSEPYVLEFYRRARAAADKITPDVEIIFVDDGSPDAALQQAVSLLDSDPCVRVIQLSRNFGHHKAMMTGLAHATGDLVFLIDSDLEEDPALLEPFYEKLISTGADVVFGCHARRPGGWLRNFGPKIHYRASALLCDPPLHENTLTVRLMTADYVRSLVQHQERELSIAGLWQITGFYQVPMSVNKAWKGTTTYTFRRKVATLVDNVTSFSNKPLVFIFYLGAAIFIISSSAAGYLIIDRIFFRALQAGWASVIVSIWMLGGVTIFCIGLVGIYVSKVFIETKQRPYTIIRRIYGSDLTTREPSSLKTAFPAAHLSNGKRVTSEPEGLATGNR